MDYMAPDYPAIQAERTELLARLRKSPGAMAGAKAHYKNNPWDFIKHWGMTFEPRNVEKGLPADIPFVPWEQQEKFLRWLYARWQAGERGLVEKTRDYGATWLAVGFACTMFLFHPGFTAGFGSRKEALVDKKGDPKCIFEKARHFLARLPKEFRPNYDDAFLKIINHDNGATITGEAGDDIGRGARMSMYFVDESAFLARQALVDAALSQTTNCQIDISTPNGNGNAFYKKRMGNKIPVFVMDWRDDPRKTQEWYEQQVREQDEVTVAQEINRDYNASAENVFIPSKWVEAARDAHLVLGFEPRGYKRVVFDPADVGDAKALLYIHGSVILDGKEIKQGDITDAVPQVEAYVKAHEVDAFIYDADGMGAPIVKLSLQKEFEAKGLTIMPFYGSKGVEFPDLNHDKLERPNRDAFLNKRAQSMYRLRQRFENTYNAVVNKVYTDPDQMISISSDIPCYDTLVAELSRPQRQYMNGKIKVESKQDMRGRGVASPNLGDCCHMGFEEPPILDKPVAVTVPQLQTAWG